jgi:hypothetical protein
MGLSFHYNGRIAKPELLPELIDEVQEIAGITDWKYTVYQREFPVNTFGKPHNVQNIYGISVTPPGCEPVFICFLSNGRMSSPIHLKFYGKAKEKPERDYLYMLSVKTQYSSVEAHQFIIQLFRYLNTKYFADFKLSDEGDYWETNDLELLRTNFKRNADLINSFSNAIEIIPKNSGESIEDYFKRLIKLIQDRKKQ